MTLSADFERFHEENPHLYRLFKQYALQAAAKRQHFSAYTIRERIRWYTQIETVGDDFKFNNNWTPFYARMFERDHPEHKGFFRMREAAADAVVPPPEPCHICGAPDGDECRS